MKKAASFSLARLFMFPLLIGGGMGLYLYLQSSDTAPKEAIQAPRISSPIKEPGESLHRQSPEIDKFQSHLRMKNWQALKEQMDQSTQVDKLLTQLSQKVDGNEDAEEVFRLVFPLLVGKEVTAKVRVLAVRVISRMNLNASQQKEIRNSFQLNHLKAFKEDLYPQTHLSTVPFPKELTTRLKRDYAASPSRGKEVLFLTASLKDKVEKRNLEKSFLAQFAKTPVALKPFVVKSLVLTMEPELKTDKDYQTLVSFAKKQQGEIWNDIKGLLQ